PVKCLLRQNPIIINTFVPPPALVERRKQTDTISNGGSAHTANITKHRKYIQKRHYIRALCGSRYAWSRNNQWNTMATLPSIALLTSPETVRPVFTNITILRKDRRRTIIAREHKYRVIKHRRFG